MTIEGAVIGGRRLGRRLGFPTANIEPGPGEVVPELAEGVYAAAVEIDGRRYAAVSNWGANPSVGGCRPRLETHILDFDGELYGRRIRVELLRRIRGERRFGTLEELSRQIEADCRQVRALFAAGETNTDKLKK